MKKEEEKIFCIDPGYSSIGFAAMDGNCGLLKVNGKYLYMSKSIDTGQKSGTRRIKKAQRHCNKKQKARLETFFHILEEEIKKIDKNFFIRLKNGKFDMEDKDPCVKSKNQIFDDPDYTDKDYYAQYPTIYHLIVDLMYNPCPHDPRLVYLAIKHKLEHRGNFLYGNMSKGGEYCTFGEFYDKFCDIIEDEIGIEFPRNIDTDEMKKIISDRNMSLTQKKNAMVNLFDFDKRKNKQEIAFLNTMCGSKVNISELFEDLAFKKDEEIKICFSKSFNEEEIEDAVGEGYYHVIDAMACLYASCALSNIIGNYLTISEARVASHDLHSYQLSLLKEVIKKYRPEEYDDFFRNNKDGSYSAYVKSTNCKNKKQKRETKHDSRTLEEVCKKIKKILKGIDDPDVIYILDEVKKGTFLQKQMTASNGIIPNQLHLKELEKILENARKYIDRLNEVDEDGVSNADKIILSLSSVNPFYVGPVGKDSKTGWAVLNDYSRPVFPWNIDKMVDMKKTRERFVINLVGRCSYFKDKKVIPKNSLLYEAYSILNIINTIRVDGQRMSVELKQDIYNDLVKNSRLNVTKTRLVDYLVKKGVIEDKIQLSGFDDSINIAAPTYRKFKSIFGEKIEKKEYQEMAEGIVFLSTAFGESRDLLKECIKESYGDMLTDEELLKVSRLKFKNWGKLSREFLMLEGEDTRTGSKLPLIEAMWMDNRNMMELTHSPDYTYKDEIAKRQEISGKTIFDITPEDLDGYYLPPQVRKIVWQTLRVVKEGVKEVGIPTKIFIESARDVEDPSKKGKRTISRKDELTKLYKNVNDDRDWTKEIEEAAESGRLNDKRIYTYYLQMGRDIYTGEPISLNQLTKDNWMYDLDHIIAKSLTNDNNIKNNLVLTRKDINNTKKNKPVKKHIVDAMKPWWRYLLELGFMNKEKYDRLTRTTPLTEEEKAGFIEKQLVGTRYATTVLAQILESVLPDTKVICIKAGLVSEFRQKFNIPKVRSVNNLHHAQDAYLAGVVGNVYYTKFTIDPLNFIKNEHGKNAESYNLGKMFESDVSRNGKTVWVAPDKNLNGGTIETVRKMINKNVLQAMRTMTGHGEFAKANLSSAKVASKNPSVYMPAKTSDERMRNVSKYGGYAKIKKAYAFLVEHGKKKKRIRTIDFIPLYLMKEIESREDGLKNYCEKVLGLVNPDIRIPKIPLNTMVERDGYRFRINGSAGTSLALGNATPLYLDKDSMAYAKKLENIIKNGTYSSLLTKKSNMIFYDMLLDKHKNGIFSRRPTPIGRIIENGREKFENLNLEDQCYILNQLLRTTAIAAECKADLTKIGGNANSGKMSISKNIGEKGLFLILQSVTGIREKKIDLTTV